MASKKSMRKLRLVISSFDPSTMTTVSYTYWRWVTQPLGVMWPAMILAFSKIAVKSSTTVMDMRAFKKRRRCFRHYITKNSHVVWSLAMIRWMTRITLMIGLRWRLSVTPATTVGTRLYNHAKTKTSQRPNLSRDSLPFLCRPPSRAVVRTENVHRRRVLG